MPFIHALVIIFACKKKKKKIELRCVMYQQVGGIWQTEEKKNKRKLWSAKRGHRPRLWGDEIKHG